MKTNKLGVLVTRPDQVLIVMRGIPGAGKSTRSKQLVGEGIIHSTDDLIEAQGDYREFFVKMFASKNFIELNRMHSKNLRNATKSIYEGLSPIIIDNTNIKHVDAKAYVKMALEAGLADENIKFEDVGTGGIDAEVLAERNTHGVPLETIKSMIASHKGQGEITLQSVLNKKDMFKQSNVLYSCVLLDNASKTALLTRDFPIQIPDGWTEYGHHMTINLGPLKGNSKVGDKVSLTVEAVGISDKAMAVKVSGHETKNDIPHITLAVNPDGGKPVMSNDITKWQDIKPFMVQGVVTEIKKN